MNDAGEVAQELRALATRTEDLGSISQCLHGDSQPSVTPIK